MAFAIGLNSEEAYIEQGLTEEKKEIMRACWWSLYTSDRLVAVIRGELSLIKDEDCKCRLLRDPMNVDMPHPMERQEEKEIAIMTSPNYYVLSIKGLYFRNYFILLVKIMSQIHRLRETPRGTRDHRYRKALLETSLDDWFNNLPEDARNVMQLVGGDAPPANPFYAWHNAFMLIIYYSLKASLQRGSLMDNVKADPLLAVSSPCFKVCMGSASECALIVACFMRHIREFYYVPLFMSYAIFASCLLLPLAARLPLPPADLTLVESSYSILHSAITQLNEVMNIGHNQKKFLDKLWECQNPQAIADALSGLKSLKGERRAKRTMEGRKGQSDTSSQSTGSPAPMAMEMSFSTQTFRPEALALNQPPALLNDFSTEIMGDPFAELMMGVGDASAGNIFGFNLM